MQKFVKSRLQTIGLPPGSLVHVGERKRDTTLITLYEYSEDIFEQKEIKLEELSYSEAKAGVVKWLNIEGLHEVDVLEKVGETFNLHPLVLEDILNTDQRPKIEFSDDYIYISAKMLLNDTHSSDFFIEQVSFVIGKNYILSFSERDTDIFEPVVKRLKQSMSRIRKLGPDYMTYCLLDIIVDNYFSVLEKLGDQIEFAEDEMLAHTTGKTLKAIHRLKRQVLFLHKAIWPLRDVLSSMGRGESDLVNSSTEIYIRDLYEHVIQIMDTTETLRDILSGMLDVYLSTTSNRMNEIMKVLTIISTIFIPLTFLVGVYGMNFKYMPELNWPYMYPLLWLIMGTIAALMIYYFKKKNWW